MMPFSIFHFLFSITNLFLFVLFIASDAAAQSGSLGGSTALTKADGKPLRMAEASLTWQAAPRQKVYQINDIIYVHYKQSWNYNNVANNQRKKSIKANAKISGWFKWPDLFSMPVKSDAELPEIGGELDHKTQNQGNLLRKETLDFNIACHVSSIQDNGNLFIEGTFSSNIGEEGKVMYISGYVRPESIGGAQNNTIESSMIDDLHYKEIPSGNVYDTTRRTWGARWIEHWKPF
ncbi:MAG: flagellar basal body L-ring protein FlgH [Planctomycetaceae bacterium]|jgi:flagellar basal body L-ring protein FlgH|nr:flagellar basal body L-ring protein FlgH [Planctomycetaceae bacterium]